MGKAHYWCIAAIGGALGTLLRFKIGQWLPKTAFGISAGLWAVNLAGCALAGLVLAWLDTKSDRAFWQSLLLIGFLGGLTTFSAFGVELWQLLRSARLDLVLLVGTAHMLGGLLCVMLGWKLGRFLMP